MEEALLLLREAGNPPLAADLAEEIEASLEELKPDCALDQLKVWPPV
jgi:hypothetical protein